MSNTRRSIIVVTVAVLVAGSAMVLPLAAAETGTAPDGGMDNGDVPDEMEDGDSAQATEGEPDLSASLSDAEVDPGTTAELDLELANDGEITEGSGDEVTDARSVVIEVDDDGPFEADMDETTLGEIADGSSAEAAFSVDVPSDIEPGDHDVTVEVSYSYDEEIASDGSVERASTTETHDVTLEVPDEPEFSVSDVSAAIEPGASGDAEIEIENTGTATANETRATVTGGEGVSINDDVESAGDEEPVGDEEGGDETSEEIGDDEMGDEAGGEEGIDEEGAGEETDDGEVEDVELSTEEDPGSEEMAGEEMEEAEMDDGAMDGEEMEAEGGQDEDGDGDEMDGQGMDDEEVDAEEMEADEADDEASADEPLEESLGDLEPGETTSATVTVGIDESASDGAKPLTVEFAYEDENGVQRDGIPESAVLEPAGEQAFTVQNVEDDLGVDQDGDITGEIRNDGDRSIDDAVVVAEPLSDSVVIDDTHHALPEIEPGETGSFHYPTEVSSEADGGDRHVEFTVEYTDDDDSALEDGPYGERVVVDEQSDEFKIADENVSVTQGENEEFTLEVTNERSETLSNVDAMLYTDGDLETADDESFADELEPGESAELTFDVSAADDATVETHPVELDFEYETDDGETTVSDTYQQSVEVEATEDDGGPFSATLVAILGSLAVAGVGLTLWWRRE